MTTGLNAVVKTLVDKPTTLLLDGAKLQQIASAYKDSGDSPVVFTCENEKGTFKLKRSTLKIDMADSSGYPCPPKIEGEFVTIKLKHSVLVDSMQRTRHAIASGDVRAMLNGMNLNFNNSNCFTLTSTDGHRVFRSVMTDVQVAGAESVSIIIPSVVVDHVAQASNDPDSDVVIKVNNDMAEFTCPRTQVRTVLIDAAFPSIDGFITSPKTALGNASKSELVSALTRLRAVLDNRNAVDLDFNEGEISMAAHDNAGKLSGEDAVPCETLAIGTKVRFSCRYLLEALASIDDGEVALSLDNEKSFLLLQSMRNVDQSAIIMPLMR